jgi:hypothetical protein
LHQIRLLRSMVMPGCEQACVPSMFRLRHIDGFVCFYLPIQDVCIAYNASLMAAQYNAIYSDVTSQWGQLSGDAAAQQVEFGGSIGTVDRSGAGAYSPPPSPPTPPPTSPPGPPPPSILP